MVSYSDLSSSTPFLLIYINVLHVTHIAFALVELLAKAPESSCNGGQLNSDSFSLEQTVSETVMQLVGTIETRVLTIMYLKQIVTQRFFQSLTLCLRIQGRLKFLEVLHSMVQNVPNNF